MKSEGSDTVAALTSRQKHTLLWSKITQSSLPNTWILVGPQLQTLYDRNKCEGKETYLSLVCLEMNGNIQYSLTDLRANLMPHKYDEQTCEARLDKSNIILNIWSLAKEDDATAVTNLSTTLLRVGLRDPDVMETYLLLNDHGSIQTQDWSVLRVEHHEVSTVFTEEQYFFDGIATLAGRNISQAMTVACPLGQKWCFLEWDGLRSVDGLGRYNWIIPVWREHEAHKRLSLEQRKRNGRT